VKSCFECASYVVSCNESPCRECLAQGNMGRPQFERIIKKADTREGVPVVVGGESYVNSGDRR
jgi:hypothetical protein